MSNLATKLTAALTFAHANAARLMRSSKAKAEIRVYVEDEGDVMFWRHFLSKYDDLYNFNISVYQKVDRDVSGKDSIMKAVNDGNLILHSYTLVCIDADYDLLIDDYHNYTHALRENPYVITTRWYAIENIKADSIHLSTYYNYCTLSDICSIDFVSIVEDISKAYFELLLRLILCQSKKELKEQYTIDAFGDDLKECKYDENNKVSTETYNYINERIVKLDAAIVPHANEISTIINDLQSIGVKPENCYRMFQGHYWVERIIVPLIYKFADEQYRKMILKKLAGIPTDEEHKNERQQVTSHYNNNIGVSDANISCKKDRITRLINDQIHNDDVEIAKYIRDDIDKAIKHDLILSIIEGLKKRN